MPVAWGWVGVYGGFESYESETVWVREEVSGRVKVILIIITLRKWVSSTGIFYSCFGNEELLLQRVS